MVEQQREEKLPKADKPGVGTIISNALYMVTAIMILAYMYQSFAPHF